MKKDVDLREFKPIFDRTDGIGLSQLCAISGLEATTIQNWVKRGWVPRPRGKFYSETALARILILDRLRQSMQLEKIVFLMTAINGSVEDRSDDTIPDALLYDFLRRMTREWQQTQRTDEKTLLEIIHRTLADFRAPSKAAYDRLVKALAVMLYAGRASDLASRAEELYQSLETV